MFHDRLEQEIKKADRAELKIALLFIDLDKFKEVNDTLGHTMGDILLQEAAHRIGDCVRETDTVARLGGDEFTVILAELDDTGSVERVAENILQSLAKPFLLENEMVYVSASIGITLYPRRCHRMWTICSRTPTRRCMPPRTKGATASVISPRPCSKPPRTGCA